MFSMFHRKRNDSGQASGKARGGSGSNGQGADGRHYRSDPATDGAREGAGAIVPATLEADAYEVGGDDALTELVFILDRSGSMAGLESDTIGGFNSVLNDHRQAPGDAVVSTVLFDHVSEVLHDRVPIRKVANLTERDYTVRGSTALYDAVGNAVQFIGKVQRYLPAGARPQRTIVVIVTDGYENASTTWTHAGVRELIQRKRKEDWEFLFLGANIDAEREAESLGMDRDLAATFVADSTGQLVMYEAMNRMTQQMRCGARPTGTAWRDAIDRDRKGRKRGRK